MSKKIQKYPIKKASEVFGQALKLSDAADESIYLQMSESNKPKNIIFDIKAFWELMCQIDEALFDKLSDEDYQKNPAGRIVDAIEANWDFSQKASKKAKADFQKAFDEIKQAQAAA